MVAATKRCICSVLSYPKAYDMVVGLLFVFEEFPKVNIAPFEVDTSHVHLGLVALCLTASKIPSCT
jgi:hypothetical protein